MKSPVTQQRTPVIPTEFIEACKAEHDSFCPRQVLGLRIGMAGPRALGLDAPRDDKRLLTLVETDGCFVDGVIIATGCTVGHHTLRVVDYGKVAATFIDVETGDAVRIWPRSDSRKAALAYASPDAESNWHAQLEGYQVMPDDELLHVQPVELTFSLEKLLGRAGDRMVCEACGEEILNQRGVVRDGRVLCRGCADGSYFALPGDDTPDEISPLSGPLLGDI